MDVLFFQLVLEFCTTIFEEEGCEVPDLNLVLTDPGRLEDIDNVETCKCAYEGTIEHTQTWDCCGEAKYEKRIPTSLPDLGTATGDDKVGLLYRKGWPLVLF